MDQPQRSHWVFRAHVQDRAGALGLDMLNSGPAVWFDADNDLDADMLIAEDDSLVLYRRVDRGYQRERVGAYRGAYKLWNRSKFSLFDLGGDGYLDALQRHPEAKEPSEVIGAEFARACGKADDLFAAFTGGRMFSTTTMRVREYLDAANLQETGDGTLLH